MGQAVPAALQLYLACVEIRKNKTVNKVSIEQFNQENRLTAN